MAIIIPTMNAISQKQAEWDTKYFMIKPGFERAPYTNHSDIINNKRNKDPNDLKKKCKFAQVRKWYSYKSIT